MTHRTHAPAYVPFPPVHRSELSDDDPLGLAKVRESLQLRPRSLLHVLHRTLLEPFHEQRHQLPTPTPQLRTPTLDVPTATSPTEPIRSPPATTGEVGFLPRSTCASPPSTSPSPSAAAPGTPIDDAPASTDDASPPTTWTDLCATYARPGTPWRGRCCSRGPAYRRTVSPSN